MKSTYRLRGATNVLQPGSGAELRKKTQFVRFRSKTPQLSGNNSFKFTLQTTATITVCGSFTEPIYPGTTATVAPLSCTKSNSPPVVVVLAIVKLIRNFFFLSASKCPRLKSIHAVQFIRTKILEGWKWHNYDR